MIRFRTMLPISCEGTIFDIETTGFSPSTDKIITIGLISANEIQIYQREGDSISEENSMQEIIKGLTTFPRPYMAYNKSFEERWLRFNIDVDLFEEWKEWAQIFKAKQPKLKELVPLLDYFSHREEPIWTDVVSLWKGYLQDQIKDRLHFIMLHNLQDLMRSLLLYIWEKGFREWTEFAKIK